MAANLINLVVAPLNVLPTTFNLVSIQLSLFTQGGSSAGKIEALQSAIYSSASWHQLCRVDSSSLGAVTNWAANLTDNEIDFLTLKIKNQKKYFWLWNMSFAQNGPLFLKKKSNDCYCDPFNPLPKVYRGHVIFSSDPDLNNTIRAGRERSMVANPGVVIPEPMMYNLHEGSSHNNVFHIGILRMTVFAEEGYVEVKINRKAWANSKRKFQIRSSKADKVRGVLSLIQEKNLIVVDINVKPVGKIWHSYSLRRMFDVICEENYVYYQENSQFNMVAGSEEGKELWV